MASIENKIRDMMNHKAVVTESYPGMGNNKETAAMAQGSSGKSEIQMMNVTGAAKPGNSANKLAAGAGAMESKPMKQGSSQDASIDSEDDETTQGKTHSAKAKKQPVPTAKGAGAAPNYTTHADPTSVVNQASSAGNVYREEAEMEEDEEVLISEEEFNALSDEEQAEYEPVFLEEVEEGEEGEEVEEAMHMKKKKEEIMKKMKEELSKDIENLLSSETDLSEDFKVKATSLFEAVVTARVAHEMEIMEDVLAEQAAEVVAEMHQELVNKVDAYLNYVVEQWVEQNALAVENGLRTEVTEDFIAGLKVLFQENYIEVPEEQYDVLGEMQNKIEELTAMANEAIAEAVELKKALTESERDAVFVKVTADLAQTESEKLHGLVEEVEFDTPELFEQKLTVIKNNYFPKTAVENSTLPEEQPIVEETSGSVAQYAARISRSKF